MSFEFFFSIFGLISGDSKSRHKSRPEDDWRLFIPLGASLFRDADQKATPSPSFKSSIEPQRSIFSTGGTLTSANNSVSDGVFISASSTSSSSIISSGSTSSVASTDTLIKPSEKSKYELLEKAEAAKESPTEVGEQVSGSRWRILYCRFVCLILWMQVFRLMLGLVVERSLLTLDFFYIGTYKIHFLIPALCLAIQVAAVSLIFIRNNEETNWLVPFYSSKDYLIRSRSNFRPKMEEYTRRVNISITLALSLATISATSLAAFLFHCVMQSEAMQSIWTGAQVSAEQQFERPALTALLIIDIFWALYSLYICVIVSFYFNLICSIMKARFHSICKIIEDLAESDTTKTTNQARKITTLYLEHNEACELLDESNDFWQYLIFFTYFTYIPAYCYCLYNLFFVDFEPWPSFITWVIHCHTGLIILLISFSAAGVSTEAHAPYTSLHTLSLIQLPLDVEVNIATFLHRVRGLTIGYSCYDLFAITNASMSNTAAACASYFLIVADFSRSSVFTLSQVNGSSGVVQNLATPAPTG